MVKVVVLGRGQMGSGMIKLLLQKSGIDLVGVYGRRASRAGLDVGKAIGLDTTLGVQVTNDLPAMLEHTRPHVVLQATCSRVSEAVDEITTARQHSANVISIAEEMAHPASQRRRSLRYSIS